MGNRSRITDLPVRCEIPLTPAPDGGQAWKTVGRSPYADSAASTVTAAAEGPPPNPSRGRHGSDAAQIALLQRWCDLGLEALGAAREEIDALNVYPVPDGDTGTNLYLTFEAARQALVDAESTTLVGGLTVFARGALLGARGNSGVILSQLMRAGADQLLRGDPTKPGQLL